MDHWRRSDSEALFKKTKQEKKLQRDNNDTNTSFDNDMSNDIVHHMFVFNSRDCVVDLQAVSFVGLDHITRMRVPELDKSIAASCQTEVSILCIK